MDDKRRDERFKRQYIIIYSLKEDPTKSFEVSGMQDISKGGLKFVSYDNYAVGTVIVFQVKFPFNYPNATRIEGKVVGAHQMPNAKSYKISINFINLDGAAAAALDQMEKINSKVKP